MFYVHAVLPISILLLAVDYFVSRWTSSIVILIIVLRTLFYLFTHYHYAADKTQLSDFILGTMTGALGENAVGSGIFTQHGHHVHGKTCSHH